MGRLDECVCGHASYEHIALPGFPGGCDECQGDDLCDCGKFRPVRDDLGWGDDE